MYPDHGYIVIGAIGDGVDQVSSQFQYNKEDHDYHHLNYAKYRYGIDGYADCGNAEMLAVVKDRLRRNLLLALLFIALLGGLIYGGLSLRNQIPLDPNLTDFQPNIEMPENADPSRISIPGFNEINMLADTDEIYVALWNPDTNPCYFKFTIYLEENNQVLFESGLVPPGKAITTVKLNEKLKEGRYPIGIDMKTFSLEDGETPLNSGTSRTVINSIKK